MGKKYVYLTLIFLLCMISISAVNAAEDSSSDIISVDENSEINLEQNINECVAATAENEEPVSTDEGTFDALQTKINNAGNGSTITLENDYLYNSEFQDIIVISKPLTIDGKGHTIDGNGQARIFNIENNAKVTLKNLNIINGYCPAVGAIFNTGSDLTIINVHFENNQAGGPDESPVAYAGTIINSEGNLTIINSTIENSQATVKSQNGYLARGGAIANIGNLTIINSNFTNNQVTGYYAHGGVINSQNGNVTIINSNFKNNRANGNDVVGGVIYVSEASLTITNSNFTNNQINGNKACGGAIYAEYCTLTITNSTFENNQITGNTEAFGGAINTYSGYLNMTNSTFNYNKVEGNRVHGGAISNSGGNLTAVNSTFENNTITGNTGYGGAIDIDGAQTHIINSTFENNIINGGNTGYGGAIYASDCNLNITCSNFTYNRATGSSSKGNAISAEDNEGKTTIITNSIFVDNDVSAVYDNSTDTFFIGLVFEMDIPNFYAGSTITIRITETKTQNFNGTVKVRIGDENYTIEIRNGKGEQTTTPNLSPGAYTAILNFEGRGEYSR